MCGHVGMAGVLAYKDEATMKRLLLLDYARGPDSTGFAAIRKTNEVHIAKIGSHPLDLFDMTRFKAALAGSTSKVFMGHNRAATRGAISTYNAHPYEFDHIVGAHNGTLDYTSAKELEDLIGVKHPVDSMAIFESIANVGIAETAKCLKGAWALVWYDTSDGTLNFLRNKERPMYYAWSKDFKILFWASEWEMLEAAIKMSSNKYEMYEERGTGYQFFPMSEDVHYKFDVQAIIDGDGHKPKPKCKTIKGKEAAPVKAADPFSRTDHHGSGSNIIGFHTPDLGDIGIPRTSTTTVPSRGKDAIHLKGDADDPFAGAITKDQFEKVAKFGCSWCGDDVSWGDKGLIMSIRHETVICGKCSCKADSNRVYTPDFNLYLEADKVL